jgi:hypothetical protein
MEETKDKRSIYALNRRVKTINRILSDEDLIIKKNILINEINELNIKRKNLKFRGEKTRIIDITITDKKISLEKVNNTLNEKIKFIVYFKN